MKVRYNLGGVNGYIKCRYSSPVTLTVSQCVSFVCLIITGWYGRQKLMVGKFEMKKKKIVAFYPSPSAGPRAVEKWMNSRWVNEVDRPLQYVIKDI